MGRKGSGDLQLRTEDSMPSTSDQSSEEGESTSQLHVLAVDDSIIDRKVIEKLLKNSCYRVTTVDSGRRALDFLGLGDDHNAVNDLQVNMIITDYCMPGMSGYDLLKRVKESSKLKEIPVVVMSSENVPSRKRRCLDEGAEEFIMKPVQVSDVKRLRDYMARVHEEGRYCRDGSLN
jgi:two-component response regulator (ARR-A family)